MVVVCLIAVCLCCDDDQETTENDKNTGESWSCPLSDKECTQKWCPKGTIFIRGTDSYRVSRSGPRWAGWNLPSEEVCDNDIWPCDTYYYYKVKIADMCIGQYEASAPGATAIDAALPPLHETPGALSRGEILPWSFAPAYQMYLAAALRGARLPTFEELQYSAVQGEDAVQYRWVYGPTPDCKQSEKSWFETCEGPREGYPDVGVSGGPNGRSDYGTGIYDLLGNLSELTSSLWDPHCFPDAPIYWGQGLHGIFNWPNRQSKSGGCWKFEDFAGHVAGEHFHPLDEGTVIDDGFRLVFTPHPELGRKKIEDLWVEVKLPLEIEVSWFNLETQRLENWTLTIPEKFWEL